MKKLIPFVLMIFPLFAIATEFSKVQLEQSSIAFVSKQMNVPVEGGFKKFTANLRFNPAKPEKASATIVIELASIDAGSMEANEEVKGKSWFGVDEYPKAEFTSTAIKALGGNKFEAVGKMTIKGKSNEVRAPFTLKEDKGVLNIEGVFPLKRLDFGIGSGLWSDTSVVADEVQIKFMLLVK